MKKKIIEYDMMLGANKVPKLIKKKAMQYETDLLNDPKSVVNFFCKKYRLNKKADEMEYIVALNTKGYALGVFEIGHGTHKAAYISPRGVFMRNLMIGADHFVFIHNHPSGIPFPSPEDVRVTEDLKKCGKLLGIALVDSIIIGENDKFYSIRENADCLWES